MLVDRRRQQGFLQCLYVCWQCVCTGSLWTHRARPLRFHWVKRGHSCTDQHWNPPHPRQLHRSTNKGHAVWVKRLQIYNSEWSWSAWALIHFCRPNTIDASQSPPGSRPAGPDKDCPQIPDQCSLADMYSCSKKKKPKKLWVIIQIDRPTQKDKHKKQQTLSLAKVKSDLGLQRIFKYWIFFYRIIKIAKYNWKQRLQIENTDD